MNNPFYSTSDLSREFGRLFDDLLNPNMNRGYRKDTSFVPACEVEEAEGCFRLNLEMPGVKKEDIQMEVNHHQLLISGERQTSRKKENDYAYSEREYGKFRRAFSLPVGTEVSQIEASYQDGVLSIYVPKMESIKPRQIPIQNGGELSILSEKKAPPSTERKEKSSVTPGRAAS